MISPAGPRAPETPSTGAGARPQVAEAVDEVQAWIARRQRAMVRTLHSCGQSPAQLAVLALLREVGPTTVSHLATHLEISPPSASAMVDRMVDAGLLLRERSEEDRRVVTVSLSTAGENGLRRAVGGRRELLERVLSQLTDEELRDTVRVITRLETAIGVAHGGPAVVAEAPA